MYCAKCQQSNSLDSVTCHDCGGVLTSSSTKNILPKPPKASFIDTLRGYIPTAIVICPFVLGFGILSAAAIDHRSGQRLVFNSTIMDKKYVSGEIYDTLVPIGDTLIPMQGSTPPKRFIFFSTPQGNVFRAEVTREAFESANLNDQVPSDSWIGKSGYRYGTTIYFPGAVTMSDAGSARSGGSR
jgi:hypothetical protein